MSRNRQPELYAAAIITYTAATVALIGRLIARRKTVRVLTWDDYLAIFAFVSNDTLDGMVLCSQT